LTVDDGEPSHSAGDPILGQIRSKGITNVLIVVVRYFGGTKLGVSGLIAAYKAAAEDALSKTIIIEKEITQRVEFIFSYESTAEIMRLIKEFNLTTVTQSFEVDCNIQVNVPKSKWQLFEVKMKLMTDLKIPFTVNYL